MFVLRLSFRGTGFHGWQMQVGVPTIQQTLRAAIERIFDTDQFPNPSGCGRTDEGVHAIDFIATVKAARDIAPDNLRMGLNTLLPRSIRVLSVERREGYRDARTLVAGKHYRYIICRTEVLSPFLDDLVWQSRYPLDIEPMRAAAAHLVGTQDFKSFQASNTDVTETVRTIYHASLQERGPVIVIDVIGNGFLKHMMRILCGTLVSVAKGRIAPDDIPSILAARDRSYAGETLPGKGLYLYRLFENESSLRAAEPEIFSPDILWKCR